MGRGGELNARALPTLPALHESTERRIAAQWLTGPIS
jgi:hypothetical protein